MNKHSFCQEIRAKLKGFKTEEVNRIVEYYEELIDEMVEAGSSEEEVIASFGNIDNNLNRIKADLVLERSDESKPKFLRNAFIILGICSTPVLVPVGIAFLVVFITVLITIGVLFVSFGAAGIGFLFSSIAMIVGMLASGEPLGVVFIFVGTALIVSSLFGALANAFFKLVRWSLNQINKIFSKKIKNKSKDKE